MEQAADGSRYRGLILDFVGVLTTGVRETLEGWCVAEGLAPDAWRRTLEEHPDGRRLYVALETGGIGQREWNRRTAELLGVEGDDLMGRAWASVAVAEGMVALACAARRAGLVVALLSNSFGLDPYNPYEALGVWDLFDVRVISEREGVAKPDRLIYERTLERMGLPGEACVFVDDNVMNLPPAQELGITTVHADGQADTVSRITEMLKVLPAVA